MRYTEVCPTCGAAVPPTTGRPRNFHHYIGMGEWACQFPNTEPFKSILESEAEEARLERIAKL